MQLVNCSNLKNERVKSRHLPTPDVPDDMFKLHTLSAFIGCRGSGKTNAVCLLARRYIDLNIFNRVFIMSPTYESNPCFDTLGAKQEDIYQSIPNCIQDLTEILEKIKQDATEYEEYEEYKMAYRRCKRGEGTMHDYAMMEANNNKPPPNIPKPCPLLIIDDFSHSALYQPSRKNPFINLCLRHRHLYKIGLSIFMLVQNYKTGLPKCLRQNVQQFFIWPTHDYTQLEEMYQEFANVCTWEQFFDCYKEATKGPHNFMTVDLNPIHENQRFRKNFDTAIVISNLQPQQKRKRNKFQEDGESVSIKKREPDASTEPA